MKKSVNIPIWVVILVAIAIGVLGTLTLKPFVYDIYLSSTVDKEPDLPEVLAKHFFEKYIRYHFISEEHYSSHTRIERTKCIQTLEDYVWGSSFEVSYNYEDARWEARLIPWLHSPPLQECTARDDTFGTNDAGKKSIFRYIDSSVWLYIDDDIDWEKYDPKVYTLESPWAYYYEK